MGLPPFGNLTTILWYFHFHPMVILFSSDGNPDTIL